MTYKGRSTAYAPPGKVPGFSAKMVHFPPWLAGVPAPQASLAELAISTPGKVPGISAILVHFPRGRFIFLGGGVFWRGPAGHAWGNA